MKKRLRPSAPPYHFWELEEKWSTSLERTFWERRWEEFQKRMKQVLREEREKTFLTSVVKEERERESAEVKRGKSSSRLVFLEKLEQPLRKLEEKAASSPKKGDWLFLLVEWCVRGIWVFCLRLVREVKETSQLFWIWILGYFRSAEVYTGDFSPLRQLFDLGRFLLWLGPSLYFFQQGKIAEGVAFFVTYYGLHRLIYPVTKRLGYPLALLPSAWEEIPLEEYQVIHPFRFGVKLFFFLFPPLYGVICRSYSLAILYFISYLAFHLLLQNLGKALGKDWSLLPEIKRKGKRDDR